MSAFDGLRKGQISHGYWGNHTGSIDWCELNYTHTQYIAEFMNTLTNLPSIILGVYGAINCLNHGLQRRYALCYLGLTLIGIGSTGFHASLRWEWQLMDELPMIYVVSYSAYLVLDTVPSFKPRFGIWGPLVVIAWNTFVTFSYIKLPNPVYHEVAFGAIVLGNTARTISLIRRIPAEHPSRAAVTRTMGAGVVIFAAAFAAWNVDNICCDRLRSMREVMGPWGFLLEGHAYWHLMTGYGAYLIFTSSLYAQLAAKVSPDAYTFNPNDWFPVVKQQALTSPKSKEIEKERPGTPRITVTASDQD